VRTCIATANNLNPLVACLHHTDWTILKYAARLWEQILIVPAVKPLVRKLNGLEVMTSRFRDCVLKYKRVRKDMAGAEAEKLACLQRGCKLGLSDHEATQAAGKYLQALLGVMQVSLNMFRLGTPHVRLTLPAHRHHHAGPHRSSHGGRNARPQPHGDSQMWPDASDCGADQ
jgi:hypothetical protein